MQPETHSQAGLPLFPGSKLLVPFLAPNQVPRRSAIERICTSEGAKLVLLRAPTGFGKTTVMLQCRQRWLGTPTRTAWLTLDASDNDAARFLVGLHAAVAEIFEADDDLRPPRGAQAEGTAVDLALDVFVRLSAQREPFAIFLDDFEAIHEPGVLSLVRELVDHMPPGGRLVLGSRSLPDLPLGRLRARGQLLEIDTAQLRFTLEEVQAFFALRPLMALGSAEIGSLHHKTEGWPAAIQLASAALERTGDAPALISRFSGTDRSMADYLVEEVLSGQPEPLRRFMLHASVLRQLDPALCDALMPGIDSKRLLSQLETSGVLVAPMEDGEATYRFHPLFAHFLRARLDAEHPGVSGRLHATAAAWFRQQQRPVPAIEHALEAGDIAFAIALMDQHAQALLAQGRMRLLARWFSLLPDEALALHPLLQVQRMWAVGFTQGPWQAMELLHRSGLEASTHPEIAAHIGALRPLLLAMMDRHEEALVVGRAPLSRLPSAVPFADCLLANAMATVVSVTGESREARRLFDLARHSQELGRSDFNRMYSEASEGIVDLQEGRLHQATARFELAVAATHGTGYSHANGNAWAGVPYAVSLYEADQLEEAEHLLHVYLPLARDVGLPDHIILAYVTLSRIAFWRGDVDHALRLLTELEYVGHRTRLPRVAAGAKLERARIQLLQGHVAAARDELDRAEDPRMWERVASLRLLANDLDDLRLSRLRLEVHGEDMRSAAAHLEDEAARADGQSRHRRALKLNLLRAAALHRGGEAEAAALALGRALHTAAHGGFVRIVLDEGDLMSAPLHAIYSRLSMGGPTADPVLTKLVHRLVAAIGPPSAAVPPPAVPGSTPQALTRKELRILRLLSEGYSNAAMSEKLFVSESTIRTHLRNINVKLDTHSRTHAVARARQLALLD